MRCRSTLIEGAKDGVLNVQSLGNTPVSVLDTVVDESLDVSAVVESWHDSAESPCTVSNFVEFQVEFRVSAGLSCITR